MCGCRPRATTARPGAARRALAGRVGVAMMALALALVTGCGGSARPRPAASAGHIGTTAARPCGTARTAANVPVRIRIERGAVSCRIAMQVERAYAAEIREGKAPGNGGGGPVKVRGWTCEGFPTPQVLATGQASRCVRGREEILAILPSPA